MGVDAEMFARVKGRENWLTEDMCHQAAVKLAMTIGAGNFMIVSPRKAAEHAYLTVHHAL